MWQWVSIKVLPACARTAGAGSIAAAAAAPVPARNRRRDNPDVSQAGQL
jgi:hypothetical protein